MEPTTLCTCSKTYYTYLGYPLHVRQLHQDTRFVKCKKNLCAYQWMGYYDEFTCHAALTGCYQLIQSILKIGKKRWDGRR